MLILTCCCAAANQYVSLSNQWNDTFKRSVCFYLYRNFSGLFEDETQIVTFCGHVAKPSPDLFLFFAERMAEGGAFAV